MTTSNSFGSRIKQKDEEIRGKHLQPLDESQRQERLSNSDGKIGEIPRRLNDAWSESEIDLWRSADREGMVEQVVDDLVWFDDLNHREWVYQKITESDLFKNWDGNKDDIDRLITDSDKNRGSHDHYSVYRKHFHDDTVRVIWSDGSKAKLTIEERKNADDDDSDDREDASGSGSQHLRPKDNPVRGGFGGDYNKNLIGDM